MDNCIKNNYKYLIKIHITNAYLSNPKEIEYKQTFKSSI